MNEPQFFRNCFRIDWRHKHVKNTIDLLLFYREHAVKSQFGQSHLGTGC